MRICEVWGSLHGRYVFHLFMLYDMAFMFLYFFLCLVVVYRLPFRKHICTCIVWTREWLRVRGFKSGRGAEAEVVMIIDMV
ncbi:uncharacterized protein BO95DRAFT_196609 [Aspergillus brunneoviolaceus CBS 621.78]|uniref:Uncharacterized protein n=1 Tax=Aspergillus brunneoviolaceus CBS 621.78 TaxID=1450534 RepID=A0ACD1GMB5_9EURO|nr:hypothetical protein BO95DRAFT_196609 [Aspergillus brunneoviolaceus CBS 621.78]RAH50272.1 hypothetical protein BO95DRAFT_196609 [Aspergillus brunneoviolaceus CBS 621.78]